MTCPSCGTPNEPGRKFCGECGTKLAAVCAACGTANPPTARFCGECGTALAAAAAGVAAPGRSAGGRRQRRPAAGPIAERRLVTVLFADLVGFTALSEGRDPEAVRELLSGYFDLATDVIKRYGGTVEKFIGDAVMALWGAPVAHEDDAERAVRAGLDLVDAVRALGPGIQARCGVLTGEAAVTLGATGQGMVAGDLVNTASRLQSVAPAGAVLAGESTRHATSGAIAYEEAGEQLLKGKVAPVPAFRAVRIVAERRGRGRDDRLEPPFVGRDTELRLLKDLFHATSRERRVRLVSVTGQGGIGKSRLAWEFQKYLDGLVESIFWHEGRSPAYGEGITFWSLGEMVRSRAGLLETDDPVTTRTRIAEMVAKYVPDEDERRRIEPALLALLGQGDGAAGGPAELFSAWRAFFERVAADGVVVLQFEDLHWADPGTLDFIEHLLEWSRNVPILIVTLARPELLEHRPGWGAGKRAFLALDLAPLDDGAMRELLTGLVHGLPEPAARSIVARAEGMPLYAVETIRMLVADGRLRERADGVGYEPAGELGELAVPDTLHALIAARLDGLDPADRALVQDAAVLGQSFTLEALAAVAGLDGPTASARIERLVRAELLRQELDTRSPEHGQHVFVQAMIREVAYSTLALRDRRSRHLAAARYFESIGDDELAGALAAHYLAAYRASTDGPEAEALVSQARISLRAAADRAIALGAPGQAVTFLEHAIEVTDVDADKADLHERAGNAAATAATMEVALGQFEAAHRLYTRLGERSKEARMIARESQALGRLRRNEEAWGRLDGWWDATADLGDEDPGRMALGRQIASLALIRGDYDLATRLADRVLGAAERVGNAEMAADNLTTLGIAGFYQGRQWQARALLEGARKIAEEAGLYENLFRVLVMLPSVSALDDPARRAGRRARRDRARPPGGQPERRDQHPVQRRRGRAPDRRLGLGGGRAAGDRPARDRRVEPHRQPDPGGVLRDLPWDPRRGGHRGPATPDRHARRQGRPGGTHRHRSLHRLRRRTMGRRGGRVDDRHGDERSQCPVQLPEGGPRGGPGRGPGDGTRGPGRPGHPRHPRAGDGRRPGGHPRRDRGDRGRPRRREDCLPDGRHRVPRPRARLGRGAGRHGGRPPARHRGRRARRLDRRVALDPHGPRRDARARPPGRVHRAGRRREPRRPVVDLQRDAVPRSSPRAAP